MSAIRPAVAAGVFYPGRAGELAETVGRLLAATPALRLPGTLRALVAPHAGYVYSGPVAATAFATLRGRDVSASRCSAPRTSCRSAASPFPAPTAGRRRSEPSQWTAGCVRPRLRGAVVDDEPHARDHALEVELPFLQQVLGPALSVLPVAVGADADEAAAVVAVLSADALVVVSTDLSHYHDDATARRLDRRTADAVLALDASSIGDSYACGAQALRGLVLHARRAGWACTELDLRTSGEALGDTASVVGYGAFAFTEAQ